MDDISTIFYIIIGIIYFIYSAIKKGKSKNIPQNRPRSPIPGELDENAQEQPGGSTTRRPNFEDLLREFTQPEPQVEQETVEEVYEEPMETYPTEDTYYEEKKTPSIYDDYQNVRVTEKDIVQESLFTAYEAEEVSYTKFGAEIREMLKDPKGLKKAIIINEILKPKYF